MSEHQGNKDQVFGSIRPTGNRILSGKRILILFWVGLSMAMILAALLAILKKGIEIRPPIITLSLDVSAVSTKPIPLQITATDSDSGLRSFVAYVQQGQVTKKLFERSLERVKEQQETIVLDIGALQLAEGPTELVIEAVDDSFWHSSTVYSKAILVDSVAPKIEIINATQAMITSSTGVVVYRVTDKNLADSGAKDDAKVFSGVPAGFVDAAFIASDLYISFFTTSKAGTGRLMLSATDIAGNSTSVPLPTSVTGRAAGKTVKSAVNPALFYQFSRTLFSISIGGGEIVDKAKAVALITAAQGGSAEADVEIVRLLTSAFRNASLAQIVEALTPYLKEPRRWGKAPVFGSLAIRASFGDKSVLSDGPKELANIPSDGMLFEPLGGPGSVVAPYIGVVRLSQSLGVFGKAVLIDHGAGVASMFYSLDDIDVQWGAVVDKGQRIGQLGSTALGSSKQLGVMAFIQGIPVDPQDWVDQRRYLQVIEGTLSGAKQKLGIPINPGGATL